MASPPHVDVRRVVIVGGGIAALEAVLALHDLAGPRVHVTVIAPEPEFAVRPLDVARPFAGRRAGRLDLGDFMREHGGRFRRTAVLDVKAGRGVVHCATGPDEPYDALIVAVGASARAAFKHALTIAADRIALNALLGDLNEGYLRSIAFVVPTDCAWPLPLYELALMVADEVWSRRPDGVVLHLVTPEAAPLDLFGPQAGVAVEGLLRAARLVVHHGVTAEVPREGHVALGDGSGLDVGRVVALPTLSGPRLVGLPSDSCGFLPVDEVGRVIGVQGVYAAGDATDHPAKQGALACRQADAVAAHIAAAAGAPPGAPALAQSHGRLLTGHDNRFLLRERAAGVDPTASTLLWWPPMIVCSRYLGPYLEARGLVELPSKTSAHDEGVDVKVPLRAGQAR